MAISMTIDGMPHFGDFSIKQIVPSSVCVNGSLSNALSRRPAAPPFLIIARRLPSREILFAGTGNVDVVPHESGVQFSVRSVVEMNAREVLDWWHMNDGGRRPVDFVTKYEKSRVTTSVLLTDGEMTELVDELRSALT